MFRARQRAAIDAQDLEQKSPSALQCSSVQNVVISAVFHAIGATERTIDVALTPNSPPKYGRLYQRSVGVTSAGSHALTVRWHFGRKRKCLCLHRLVHAKRRNVTVYRCVCTFRDTSNANFGVPWPPHAAIFNRRQHPAVALFLSLSTGIGPFFRRRLNR